MEDGRDVVGDEEVSGCGGGGGRVVWALYVQEMMDYGLLLLRLFFLFFFFFFLFFPFADITTKGRELGGTLKSPIQGREFMWVLFFKKLLISATEKGECLDSSLSGYVQHQPNE